MGKRILVIGSSTYHMRRWFHYVTPILPDDIKVDMFVTANGAQKEMFEGAENVYFPQETPDLLRPLLYIPKLRALVMANDLLRTFKSILLEQHYDVINVHQLFSIATYGYTKIAQKRGVKVILTPWGSDVLRCPRYQMPKLKQAFKLADVVTYNLEDFAKKYIKMYDVNPKKMFYAGFGTEIFDLIPQYKGKLSKQRMANAVGIPEADYYITCGYMADHAQRHKLMINAIGSNKKFLPKNTILLFPFTYGDGRNEKYILELKGMCEFYGLKYHFVTDYLTNEQMAMFRCLADLFIHIQPTDAASASLAEYLLADVQVINGKWLDYPHLEEGGTPYHICNSIEELPSLVGAFLRGELGKRGISDHIKERLKRASWSKRKMDWIELFKKE